MSGHQLTFLACTLLLLATHSVRAETPPQAKDDRLVVELFAEHPQLVTPTGIAVDDRGRVFVAESHTHFRPDNYDGPKHDRILIFRDTDGDGRAEAPAVFHEGSTHVMDIEFHPDGSLYVATRMDIHRLRDTDGDDRADKIDPIIRMKTTGTYPHNGLSGLAFDFAGDLNFGLGENLGHDYTLVGTDDVRLSGGGEGGSTYHVHADGTGLRRTSTGWWNPFGMCVDSFGRVFGTDNDPGASPPCRLIQVWEGADFGYEYRYGRTGLHPLISWTGDMPGTLPMRSGTGEAPCAIVSYDSDAFPAVFHGDLLVASWADHRIERFPIEQPADAGLVSTRRHVFVQGGDDFRPVGLAIAPDGTVYVSDWVSSSYQLHKQGRVWRIRPANNVARVVANSSRERLMSRHRPERERAATQLADSESGRAFLRRKAYGAKDAVVRSAAIQALIAVADDQTDFARIVRTDAETANRVLAVRQLPGDAALMKESAAFLPLAVRCEIAVRLDAGVNLERTARFLASRDPLLFHAAVQGLSKVDRGTLASIEKQYPLGVLLAMKRSPVHRRSFAEQRLGEFLEHSDPAVRFAAIKWIADDRLLAYRKPVANLLADNSLDFRLFLATVAALDRLDGKKPVDRPSSALLWQRIQSDAAPLSIRRLALRLIDPTFKSIEIKTLQRLLSDDDLGLRIEAVRTLSSLAPESQGTASRDTGSRDAALRDVVRDASQPPSVRAEAVAGLSPVAGNFKNDLLGLIDDRSVRDDVLRALIGVRLTPAERSEMRRKASGDEGVDRLLDGVTSSRPAAEDVDGWLALLGEEPGDPVAGERVFFHGKVATCSRCHPMNGRGTAVGPPMARMSARLRSVDDPRRWILQSVLQPGRDMAPQYTPWMIVTTEGKQLVGLPRRKGGSREWYLGLDGKEFELKKQDIEFHREMTTSIMPKDLLKSLTVKELRDLIAFLTRELPPGL